MGRKSRAKMERHEAAAEESIEHLRAQVQACCGGAVLFGGDPPPGIEREFLRQIIAFHEAEENERPPLDVLREMGKVYPSASRLADVELADELRRLIDDLAFLRVFLTSTDHLSDRELYVKLTEEMLLEPATMIPDDPDFRTVLDVIGGFSEADIEIYLRYYADEESRARWAKDAAGALPPCEPPPYDRDRFLPDAGWEHPGDAS